MAKMGANLKLFIKLNQSSKSLKIVTVDTIL